MDSIERQIKKLENLIKELQKQSGTSNLIKQLRQKIKNIEDTAKQKQKGEEHSRDKKR